MTLHPEASGGLRYQHLLVPLDGSELAAAAVPTARALADRFGAELHTITAVETEQEIEAVRAGALAVLGGAAAAGADRHAHVVLADNPAAAIASHARELGSSLVCLSTHGRGRVAGAVLGSVAREVMEHTREPLVAVGPFANRPRDFTSIKPVPLSVPRLVACVDGGADSEAVLPVAAAWANTLGMALTIITVAEPSPAPVRPAAVWNRGHGPQEDADAYMARVGNRWKDAAPAVNVHVVYDPISPADGVRAYLDQHPAGMIAVTTRARRGLERVLLGAQAAAIVHASTAPVLVVPLVE